MKYKSEKMWVDYQFGTDYQVKMLSYWIPFKYDRDEDEADSILVAMPLEDEYESTHTAQNLMQYHPTTTINI